MLLKFHTTPSSPYLGPLYVCDVVDIWKVTQVSLLTGVVRVEKVLIDRDPSRPSWMLHGMNPDGPGWNIIAPDQGNFGVMKSGSLAMRVVSDEPLDKFIRATLDLASISGKRVWTEPSMVSTQFSLPYVTNGTYGYVVRRDKRGITIELRHNKRLKPVCTPTISLSKGGHLLVPISWIRDRIDKNLGTLVDPFAAKKDKKTGKEYIEI
jgi:hypothetical protein